MDMFPIDEIIRSRRRTLAIIIQDDGRAVVRAPLRARPEAIEEFVRARTGWILSKQELARRRMTRFAPKQFLRGEEFLFLGDPYRLEISEHQARALVFAGGFRLSAAALPRARAVFERWYRKQALQIFSERVELYAAEHGFEHDGVRVTGARKQWGACGPRRNLRFAWRLVMAPLPMIDYVVVHELVHLRHRNHSRRFWNLIRSILPDFQQREDWLEEHGATLRLD